MLETLQRQNQCLLFKVLSTKPKDDPEAWQIEAKPKMLTIPRGEQLWLVRVEAVGDEQRKLYATLETPKRTVIDVFEITADGLTAHVDRRHAGHPVARVRGLR